jgi:hypothetical protein
VTSVNLPPVIGPIPPQTIVEGETLTFDLTPYITDPEGDVLSVISVTPIENVKIDWAGLMLVITPLESTGDTLTIQFVISDGHTSVPGNFVVIVVAVNDGPKLKDPDVSKKDKGDGTADAEFTVTVTDPDSEDVDVYVIIDGVRYKMEKVSGDLETGAVYKVKVKGLKEGTHEYNFEANDNEGGRDSLSTTSTMPLTVEKGFNQSWMWLILLLIIVVVAALFLMMMRSRKADVPEMGGEIDKSEFEDSDDLGKESEDEEEEEEDK